MVLAIEGRGLYRAPGKGLRSESAQSWLDIKEEAGGLGAVERSDSPEKHWRGVVEAEGSVLADGQGEDPITQTAEDGKWRQNIKVLLNNFLGQRGRGKVKWFRGGGKSILQKISWTFQVDSFLLPILSPPPRPPPTSINFSDIPQVIAPRCTHFWAILLETERALCLGQGAGRSGSL